MAESEAKTCPSCGARVPEGAGVCDLCGAAVSADAVESGAEKGVGEKEVNAPEAGAYCNACGWENPPKANFCSRCGERLQAAAGAAAGARVKKASAPPAASSETEAEEVESINASGGVGRQAAAVVGVAVLVVAVLWGLTAWSASSPEEASASSATATEAVSGLAAVVERLETEPLPAAMADSAEVLEAAVEAQAGTARRDARRRLVALYLQADRPGHAALVQQRLAEAIDTPLAWQRAGNLLLAWMNRLSGRQKAQVAPFATRSYERVLDRQPGNIDAKTNLAWALQFDPTASSPMRAVQLTNEVLEEAPNHLQANFNKGVFYLKIQRLEEARRQFEKVRRLAEEGTSFYKIAGRYIELVDDLRAGRAGESAGVVKSVP